MNPDLLDAECVIKHLCTQGLISGCDYRTQQLNNIISAKYSVRIDTNDGGNIRLQIIYKNERYFLPCSIIKVIAKRHHFNAENIFRDCAF